MATHVLAGERASGSSPKRRCYIVAACAAALALPIAGGWLLVNIGDSSALAIMLVAGLFAAGVAFLVPSQWLPSLALLAYVLIPAQAYPPAVGRYANAGLALLAVWGLRRLLEGGPDRGTAQARGATAVQSGAVVLFGISSVLALIASASFGRSFAWLVSIGVAVLLPGLLGVTTREAFLLTRTMTWSGVCLSIYSLVESAAGRNLVYDGVLNSGGSYSAQHWSVYRSFASFGHPLYAGTFFGLVAVLCLGQFLASRRWVYLAAATVNFLGLLVTVSRGPFAATLVAAGLLVYLSVRTRGRLRAIAAIAGLGFLAALAYWTSPLAERAASQEAVWSNGQRAATQRLVLSKATDLDWLGGGPGNSSYILGGATGNYGYIENSAFQLLLSVGLLGLLSFAIFVCVAIYLGIERKQWGAAGGLIVLTISIVGYNAIDDVPGMHVLLGVLVIACRSNLDFCATPRTFKDRSNRLLHGQVSE